MTMFSTSLMDQDSMQIVSVLSHELIGTSNLFLNFFQLSLKLFDLDVHLFMIQLK